MILKFKSSELPKIIAQLTAYVGTDGKFVLEVNKSKNKRSLNQNKYYWGVVIKIFSDESGYTPEECHQFMSNEYLQYTKDSFTFTKSTKQLDTKEFEEYVEKCRQHLWHALELHIPLPNEITEEMWIELQRKQTIL